jgi:hypothetical protein
MGAAILSTQVAETDILACSFRFVVVRTEDDNLWVDEFGMMCGRELQMSDEHT